MKAIFQKIVDYIKAKTYRKIALPIIAAVFGIAVYYGVVDSDDVPDLTIEEAFVVPYDTAKETVFDAVEDLIDSVS